MFKLNGENVQKAWDDYKGFLEGMGIKANNHAIEQAFKFGYSAGKATQPEIELQQPVVEQPEIEVIKPEHPARKVGFTRTPTGRIVTRRSERQRVQDAKLVANILQRNGDEMKLSDIIKAVNAAGADWYENSASGHMQDAMKYIPAIKKAGYGFYKYEQ